MSRDPDAPDAPDAPDPARNAELLTAYVDGVAELSPDERHRVEARLGQDPAVRADQVAVRTLVGRLRALPPEGAEPDWTAMERSIHQAVGRDVPRPWWRSWRWLVPAMTLATAAAVLLVLWARPSQGRGTSVPAPVADRTPRAPRDVPPAEDIIALWLDGAAVEVDPSAVDLLGSGEPGDDDLAQADDDPGAELDLLPATDLAWVDKLDEDALDRAEHWLARKKGS